MKYKQLITNNIFADIYSNPYEPGRNLHIEANGATISEALKLLAWLKEYVRKEVGSKA